MPHLTLEALARLVDEAPEAREQAHLDGCPECRLELAAMVEQCQALAALPHLVPGPDHWPELRTRLMREGMLADRRSPGPAVRRAAAAALLFLAGGAMGYAVRAPAPVDSPAGTTAVAVEGTEQPTDLPVLARPDAGRDVETTGEAFMAALDHYMATTGVEAADPAARLAALDNIVLTTAEALNEAPADPIISGYHLSALAQRNAVLRQLAAGGRQPVF